ncbi:unnamed protein product [Alternaria alternata]
MLEVRKSLFSASYTADELEKFEVNSTIAEEDKTYMAARTEISALATVSTLPDYVLVEAEEGHVVECYGLKAEHWTDLEIIADPGNDYKEPEEDNYSYLKDN